MATKTGGDNFLVDKGEKIGLGVAAVIGVGLLALGLMSALNRPQDPEDFSKALEAKAGQLNSAMNNPVADIPPLVGPINDKAVATPLSVDPNGTTYYDPTAMPDPRRVTPVILAMAEGQADMAVVKILANDFQFETDPNTGEISNVRVGVVAAKEPDKKIDPKATEQFMKDIEKRFPKGRIPKKRGGPMAGGGMLGGPPGFGPPGGGPPGGGPPGFGPPGGGPPGGGPPPPGGGAPGFGARGGGPPGGFGEGGLGGMFGMPGAGSAGQNLEKTYIDAKDDEDLQTKLNGRRLALTIHPQKMVVLQGSFPYRAQLEKFRLALRYQSVDELLRHPEDMPVFAGVDVQRRAYSAKGELLEEWQPVDLAEHSQYVRAVKLAYADEPENLRRVQLHEDHMLVMPLPKEYTGKYPEMNLPTLKGAIEKAKKQDPKLSAPPPSKRMMGEGNPFKREGSGPASSLFNPPGGGEGGLMPFFPPGGPGGPRGFGGKGGGELGGGGTAGSTGQYEPPDFIHVRVYDADIRDGLTYEYRARVKVKNPNYKRQDVSKASDADLEELPPLEEHWFVFPQKVTVPQAAYFYVLDPLPPNSKAVKPLPTPDPDKGQAVVQFQQWIGKLYINNKVEEPIGDWVQSELLATRGQFVFGQAFAPVPLWSPTENMFVLRELTGEKVAKGKEPRRGVILEPVRRRTLLAVDVQGGKPPTAAARVPRNLGQPTNRGGMVEDNAATEVLFLLPDGTLEVRTSAKDKADPDRKARDEAFDKWVEEAKNRTPAGGGQPKGPGGGGIDF